jgi:hypothetical protein
MAEPPVTELNASAHTVPDALILPETVKASLGLVVPIPTLPLLHTVKPLLLVVVIDVVDKDAVLKLVKNVPVAADKLPVALDPPTSRPFFTIKSLLAISNSLSFDTII